MKPVKFYLVHYNRPDFIQLQVDAFRTFCKDPEVELIVVNTGHTAQERELVASAAKQHNLRVVEYIPKMPSHTAHGEILNHIWSHIKKDKGCYSTIIDGDMFPVREFSVTEFLEPNKVFAGRKEQRDFLWHYINPGLFMVNVDNVTDPESFTFTNEFLRGGSGDNGTALDCGGPMYKYFQKYPEDKERTKGMANSWVMTTKNKNLHLLPAEILAEYEEAFCFEILGDTFFHYCRSSNWNRADGGHHARKTALVNKVVYGAISKKFTFEKTGFMVADTTHWGWGDWLNGKGSWE
jgi:hypothetical protein